MFSRYCDLFAKTEGKHWLRTDPVAKSGLEFSSGESDFECLGREGQRKGSVGRPFSGRGKRFVFKTCTPPVKLRTFDLNFDNSPSVFDFFCKFHVKLQYLRDSVDTR